MKATAPGALYVGAVTHRRLQPMGHRLRYRTYSLLFDVEELDQITSHTRFISHNRWNLFSIHDRDFGARDGTPLRAWIDTQLDAAGIDLGTGKVQLLAFPRILGYTFNPLSMWFCYDEAGELRAVLYEIHNTFGHSLSHLVPVAGTSGKPHRHSFAKELHVSPFFDQDGAYSFTLRPPGERMSVSIDYEVAGSKMLTATMSTKRRSLSGRSLLRVFVTHPLLTMKVTLGIHWHALRLLFKGARYRSVPAPPAHSVKFEGTLEAVS
jgi:DUF1365 family protein